METSFGSGGRVGAFEDDIGVVYYLEGIFSQLDSPRKICPF